MRDDKTADTHGTDEPLDIDALIARLADHSAKIGVIGLGYVGLPLVQRIAEQGFSVLGLDVDAAKVERLNRGESYIRHIDAKSIAMTRRAGSPPPATSRD